MGRASTIRRPQATHNSQMVAVSNVLGNRPELQPRENGCRHRGVNGSVTKTTLRAALGSDVRGQRISLRIYNRTRFGQSSQHPRKLRSFYEQPKLERQSADNLWGPTTTLPRLGTGTAHHLNNRGGDKPIARCIHLHGRLRFQCRSPGPNEGQKQ